MSSNYNFRQSFRLSNEILNWYPGHMRNSLIHMQAKMRTINCIIEVHDARVPFSGRNPVFLKNLVGTKPHILVLNKVDLINKARCNDIKSMYQQQEQNHVIFTNSKDQNCKGLRKILPIAKQLMKENLKVPNVDVRYKLMVAGIPNVGKSSIINALRNVNLKRGKATAVGAIAGVTRAVQNEIKVDEDPATYLIDTPGILLPNVSDVECGMKLALCACLNDDLVGKTVIADFLLYWMNKTSNFKYVDYFKLNEPIDFILPLLIKIANDFGKSKKVKNIAKNKIEVVPDTLFAAHHLLHVFRRGNLGDLNLDQL